MQSQSAPKLYLALKRRIYRIAEMNSLARSHVPHCTGFNFFQYAAGNFR
jgi:hypothetical protein